MRTKNRYRTTHVQKGRIFHLINLTKIYNEDIEQDIFYSKSIFVNDENSNYLNEKHY